MLQEKKKKMIIWYLAVENTSLVNIIKLNFVKNHQFTTLWIIYFCFKFIFTRKLLLHLLMTLYHNLFIFTCERAKWLRSTSTIFKSGTTQQEYSTPSPLTSPSSASVLSLEPSTGKSFILDLPITLSSTRQSINSTWRTLPQESCSSQLSRTVLILLRSLKNK